MATFVVNDPTFSWTGSPLAAHMSVEQFRYNITTAAPTYKTEANVTNALSGLQSWTASFEGYTGTPLVGTGLGLTYTNGYAALVESWSSTVSVPAETFFTTSSTDNWMDALPTTLSWTMQYQCKADDSTAIVASNSNTITVDIGGTNTQSGTGVLTNVSPTFMVGGIPTVTHTVQGSGSLTLAGSNNIFSAGALAPMSPATLGVVGKGLSTQDLEFSGSAFWTSITTNVSPDIVRVSVEAQGSGELTIETPDNS